MRDWVIDCSAAAAFSLPDEEAESIERFFANLDPKAPLWVPAHWWSEMANALIIAERRKRITEAESLHLAESYRRWPIQTDDHVGPEAYWRYVPLAREHGLTVYDAAYLELAGRRELGLVTVDLALAKAARKAGIRVLDV